MEKPLKIELIKQFLDPERVDVEKLIKTPEVLELPTQSFNFIDRDEESFMADVLNIKKIKDFVGLSTKSPFKYIAKNRKEDVSRFKKISPDIEEKIKKAITISIIAHESKRTEKQLDTKKQKVMVLGLDNAGKTAILSALGGKLGIPTLATLMPTINVERREITLDNVNVVLWDFGGQKEYRDNYFSSKKQFFSGADLLIYVIDVQDQHRFAESIEYFDKIISSIEPKNLPYILIFIHKYDPDIKEMHEILLQIELLKDLVGSVFKERMAEYEIYLTSIYSMISKEPEFSKIIKNIIVKEQAISTHITHSTAQKLEEVTSITDKLLEGIVELSVIMEDLKKRVITIEAKTGTVPPPPPPPASVRSRGDIEFTPDVRKAIMGELNTIFSELREEEKTIKPSQLKSPQ